MEERTVSVPSISCGHCVATIQRELGELEGVAAVSGDATTHRVTVAWVPPASWEAIHELLRQIGYPADQS